VVLLVVVTSRRDTRQKPDSPFLSRIVMYGKA